MKRSLQEIVALTMSATSRAVETAIPRVMMVKGEVTPDQLAAIYHPMVGFIVQGTKVMSIGRRELELRGPSYFLLPTHVPVTGRVYQCRDGRPYLSIGLSLTGTALGDLLEDVPADLVPDGPAELEACEADAGFVEAWRRLLGLLETPRDIPALAPVYEREILYRVLRGPQGSYLKQLSFRDSALNRICRIVQWLRVHPAEPIDIPDLARRAHMAETTFHRQFKRATGLSPVQFQKRLRLLEARSLLVFEGYSAAGAASKVGYQSASQFTREYSRFFGTSPGRHAARLRRTEGVRDLAG